jgi:transketolase
VRAAFVEALGGLMDEEERVVLLTADLGYNVLEPLARAHPDRVINVGVAEQNMAGVAAGLAHSGFIPFVYSIATFASLRGYEFIRNGAVVHSLPVRIVGIGGGFEYGSAGISHYALEDLAVMRTQPGMTVVAPADGPQALTALAKTWDLPGPVYYRIGKNDKAAALPELGGRFRVGRAEVLVSGRDVVLLATGSAVSAALDAGRQLAASGVSCGVVAVGCLAPTPRADISALLREASLAITVETHYLAGGLGSLVAEVIAEEGLACRLVRAGVDRVPDKYSGSQPYMERRFGLDADSLLQSARIGLAQLDLSQPLRVAATQA